MKIKIGTRKSQLALKQAEIAQKQIEKNFQLETEIVKINTSGDKIRDISLANVGGKGLFVKEVEQALLRKEIDVGIHSLKDLPGEIHNNLILAGFLEREDPRDVFISCYHENLTSLKPQAIIGTCAPRRELQIKKFRNDLKTETLRGNVPTRIGKAKNFAGIILALAGLKRVNMIEHITEIIPTDVMLPAVGQGVICLQCRRDDEKIVSVLEKLTHAKTKIAVTAERSFLKTIGGDCNTPLAGFAEIIDERLRFRAMLGMKKKGCFTERVANTSDAEDIGIDAAQELLSYFKK